MHVEKLYVGKSSVEKVQTDNEYNLTEIGFSENKDL